MGIHTTAAGKVKVSFALDPHAYATLRQLAAGPRGLGASSTRSSGQKPRSGCARPPRRSPMPGRRRRLSFTTRCLRRHPQRAGLARQKRLSFPLKRRKAGTAASQPPVGKRSKTASASMRRQSGRWRSAMSGCRCSTRSTARSWPPARRRRRRRVPCSGCSPCSVASGWVSSCLMRLPSKPTTSPWRLRARPGCRRASADRWRPIGRRWRGRQAAPGR